MDSIMQFETADSIAIGSSMLSSLVGNIPSTGPLSKTVDVDFRKKAVNVMDVSNIIYTDVL